MTVPDPVELLRGLVRFDTTNPPGNEAACIAHVEALLREAGVECELYEKRPGRPNLVARLPDGNAPPLVDLAARAGDFQTLLSHCRQKEDLLGFTAALVQSANPK